MEANSPELAKFVDDFVLDKVWSREGPGPSGKSLITISSQVALCDWDQAHMKSFSHLGGPTEGLSEVPLHMTVYRGFPAVISGFRVQGIKAEVSSEKSTASRE
jgi:alkylhydroperoxidase/carboxymuconolactone decarboxylase family protein YurZ